MTTREEVLFYIKSTALFAAILIMTLMFAGCGSPSKKDNKSTSEKGVYVTMNCSGVQELGYSTGVHSGGMCNADNSLLKVGDVIRLIETDNMPSSDTQAQEKIACTVYAYDAEKNVIDSATFWYDEDEGRLDLELSADGKFIAMNDTDKEE